MKLILIAIILMLLNNEAFCEDSSFLQNFKHNIEDFFKQDLNKQITLSPKATMEYKDDEEQGIKVISPNLKIDKKLLASYDDNLDLLYQSLGTLHYLQNLCYKHDDKWRDFALEIANSENLNEARHKKLYSAFNIAYRTFATNYKNCTACALEAYKISKQKSALIIQDMLDKIAYTEN